MGMADKTGEPRSEEELQEAINCVKEIMFKQSTVLPLFTVHALNILDCLRLLQNLRRLLAKLRRKRLEKETKSWGVYRVREYEVDLDRRGHANQNTDTGKGKEEA